MLNLMKLSNPAIFFVIALIYLAINVQIYANIGFTPDESNYLFTTKKMLEGSAPYKDYPTDVKPPGNYYFFSVFLLSGAESLQIIRLAAFAVNIASAAAFFVMVSGMFGRKISCISTALLFFAFSMPALAGYAMNGDRLMVAFSILSLLFFTKGAKRRGYFALSGVFLGLAVLSKQAAATIAVFYLAFMVVDCIKNRSAPGKAAKNIFIIAAFSAIPLAAVSLHYVSMDAFGEMIHWTTGEVGKLYEGRTWLENPARLTYTETLYTFSILSPLLLISVVSFIYLALRTFRGKTCMEEIFFLMLLIFASYPFVVLFRYVTIMILPMAVLAAMGLDKIFSMTKGMDMFFLRIFASIVILGLFAASLALNSYSALKLGESYNGFYMDQVEASGYVSSISDRSEKIYVYGYIPLIYYLSGRDPPAGLYYVYPYAEHVNETEQMRTIEILKMNNVRKVVVYRGQNSRDNNPITYSYIMKEYELNRTIGDFGVYTRKDNYSITL